MTKKELSQVYYLTKEIEDDERKLRELKKKAESLPSPSLTGMPRGKADGTRTERDRERIEKEEARIRKKKAEREAEREKILRYIESIPDCQLRLIFKKRFVELKSWSAVALACGGNNTADSARKMCERFLKKI